MQKHDEWMWFARQDLVAAEILYTSNEPVIGPILFHSQQCAEKALKAFLVFKNFSPKKIHDLIALTETCISIVPDFKAILNSATELNPYLAGSRYPDSHYMLFDLSIAESSIVHAKAIYNFVECKMG